MGSNPILDSNILYMKIEEHDFILESVSDSGNFFDLSLLVKVNKGKSNEREEMGKPMYGLPLSTALKYIAHYRACKNAGDSTTLKRYIEEYKKAVEELKKIVED